VRTFPASLFTPPLSDGTNTARIDPCESEIKVTEAISQVASTRYITAVTLKKNYVCNLVLNANTAEIVTVIEGTQTTTPCDTSAAALLGSTTVGNGLSFAANGGILAVGGKSTFLVGKTAARDLCVMQSGSNRVTGSITYVQRIP